MLQRIFSRGVSRQRVGDAVDHGAEAEQREALRERSATILERLERRQVQSRRAELDRQRAEREAADLAAREAAELGGETEAEADMPEEMPAVTDVADAEVGAEATVAPPEAADAEEFAEPEPSTIAEEPEVDEASMHFPVETAPEPEANLAEPEPEDAVSSAGRAEAVEFMPIAEEPVETGVTEDDAPAEASAELAVEAPETADTEFETGEPEIGHGHAEPESGFETAPEPASDEPASTGALFEDSTPLRSAVQSAHAHAAESAPAGDGASAPHRSSLADEDPQAYEALCRKAEEAKARIAKRLETLKAEEEASAAASLLDIGAAAPPLAHDDDNDE